ncbi:putative cell division control protein (Cdc5) [Aspergillus undulatus]|uniref:putative cell division control protein (Cdc5) n=1 Tax=Aspergillus undulatus TaxID=1810928 RepID=UPI003CCDF787
MPVVKGGVWTNIEDEVLRAAVSKYGLNQWARVSSLLARKTPKQCKARWIEWLDPGIRKVEWSREEDEKLLHLAKLMPTQWRTIAPIVGRTATQCLERYQKLLDEAEARENDELGLGGPGNEASAPSADDVRRLRPGELDPDPESKPARPDTIDLDEDEKEMLSEARARLANTQGKKAKRKARERQLEESRRLAVLQKRRELKNAGINIKIVTRKAGEMDYNADIPFEKPAAPGFYDTTEEEARNERQREMFDPRKQQLANKRKGDQDEDPERKKRKNDKNSNSAAFAAAARAGQMQKIREAEQSSKRRALVLPSPQVSESEMEDIIKMGMAGDKASKMVDDEEGPRGLIGNYSAMVGGTPIRTPRAPPEEDHIANEIRNIRALTETQSSLLGGENTPLHEGGSSTGFDGIAPRRQQIVTPNPMATPFRQGGAVGATPVPGGVGPGATPLRTPRDHFSLNREVGGGQLVGNTPRDIKMQENLARQSIRGKLAALPKPKETEWELEEMPSETAEPTAAAEYSEEDSAERDRREREARERAAEAEHKRQTQVYQRALPRPVVLDIDALMERALHVTEPITGLIAKEAALLIANDACRFPVPGAKIEGKPRKLERLDDKWLAEARAAIAAEVSSSGKLQDWTHDFDTQLSSSRDNTLPGLSNYVDDEEEDDYQQEQRMIGVFDNVQASLLATAEQGNKLEKKLALHYGGYQNRAKMLRTKVTEAHTALEKSKDELDAFRTLQISEEAAISRRLEKLREDVAFVMRREREAQEQYRSRKEELDELVTGTGGMTRSRFLGTMGVRDVETTGTPDPVDKGFTTEDNIVIGMKAMVHKDDQLRKAEILSVKPKPSGRVFYVHYVDFNKRLDEWIPGNRLDLTQEVEWPQPEKPDKKKSGPANKAPSKNKRARAGSRDVSATPDLLTGKNANVGKAPRPSKAGGKENRGDGTPLNLSILGSEAVSAEGTPRADSEDIDMMDASAADAKEIKEDKKAMGKVSREEEIERLRTSGSMTQNPTEIHRVRNLDRLQMGKFDIEPWYFSPYPESFSEADVIYIDEFCLSYFDNKRAFERHRSKCTLTHPPGNEIYRDDNISFFEVDGRRQRTWCRNLCLLSKLFLDHKTLYYDVDPFLFYCMCTRDETGCHLVGYFSKEKDSAEGYNLACILTLPQYQRRGFGRLLISFSYELSKREGKLGSPEKPLSDLGLLGYRQYWRETLVEILMDTGREAVSENELAVLTSMTEKDVHETLVTYRMLRYHLTVPQKGNWVIVLTDQVVDERNRRLEKEKVKGSRKIDPARLQWKPPVFTASSRTWNW